MLLQCPLCKRERDRDSLFCVECTKKMESEYEVTIPLTDNSTATESIIKVDKEEKEETTTSEIESKEQNIQIKTEKTYYELEQEKKPRKRTYTILLFSFLLIAAGITFFIYNKHIKESNLERSLWEVVQRDNSVDAYLSYVDKYPRGKYVAEALDHISFIKGNEAEAWEILKSSENSIEFTGFLKLYPNSPYEKMVKNRLDSILWNSTLKENNLQSYSDYINMVQEESVSGFYIGDAEKRHEMLTPTGSLNDQELDSIKEVADNFFSALSNINYYELSQLLAENIRRYNSITNVSNERLIGILMLRTAKENTIVYDPQLSGLVHKKSTEDYIEINLPLQKLIKQGDEITETVKGYIVHIRLNSQHKITSYYETKPFIEAP